MLRRRNKLFAALIAFGALGLPVAAWIALALIGF